MCFRSLFTGLLLLGGGYFQATHAAVVAGLYEASVAVVGQGEAERRRAFELALDSVLVKISADTMAAATPELAPLMSNAEAYVERYSYRQIEAQQVQNIAGTVPTHIISVYFSPTLLNGSLRDLGLPLWGADRPEILLWLAVQNGSGRYILAGDTSGQLRDALARAAQKYALPVVLPQMDAQDRGAVAFADIHGSFPERVRRASQRYNAEIILTGSLTRRAADWVGTWTLYQGGRAHRWQTHGNSGGDVLAVAMQGLVGYVAATFSVATDRAPGSSVLMRVEQIDSLHDCARILAYLENLSVVAKISVEQILPTAGDFRIQLSGADDGLRSALASSPMLRQVAASDSLMALHYQLIR